MLDRKEVRRNDRTTQMALVATREALDDAGLPGRLEGELAEQTGILMASGLGGTGTLIDQIGASAISGPDRLSPFFIPMAIANMASGVAGIIFGALGPQLLDDERLRLVRPCHRRGLRDRSCAATPRS